MRDRVAVSLAREWYDIHRELTRLCGPWDVLLDWLTPQGDSVSVRRLGDRWVCHLCPIGY
jgi:hypothetical protein